LDPRRNPRRLGIADGAFTSAQWALVASFSMIFLALLLNLIATQYGQGVIRAALDEGVRRATPAPAGVGDCHEGMEEVLADLLAGPLGEQIHTSCEVVAGRVVAAADAVFPGWFPGVPDISVSFQVSGVKEIDG